MIPFIDKINNPIVKAHYVKKLANILKVNEGSVELLIKKYYQQLKKNSRFRITKTNRVESNRELMIEKYLLSTLFQDKNMNKLTEKIFKILKPEDFSLPSYQKLSRLLIDSKLNNNVEFNIDSFIKTLSQELRAVFDEVYLFASIESGFEDKSVEKLAYEIKKDSLKKKITILLAVKNEEDIKPQINEYSRALYEVEKTLTTL